MHGGTVDPPKHSTFDNVKASELVEGHDIIERDAKGRISKRTRMTVVLVSPPGCYNHVHVTTKGGQQWCYDANVRLEMD